MLVTYFQGILLTSLLGAVFALILLALKPVTGKRFSESWHYYIWLVVLVAMLIPIRIELPKLPHNPSLSRATLNIEAAVENALESVGLRISEADKIQYDEEGHRLYSPHLQEKRDREVMLRRTRDSLVLGWFGVAACLFLFKVAGFYIYVWKVKKASRIVECPMLKDYTSRSVQVRVVQESLLGKQGGRFGNSPLLLGVFRPILLLPDREMTEVQLHNVLAHEITHLHRNDLLYKWLVVLVKCVHWFNPLVYVIGRQINQACEISCDLSVTESMTKEQKMSYVDTILALFADRKQKDYALTMGMTGSKELLKKRFLKMKNRVHMTEKMRKVSCMAATMMLVCVMLVSGCVAAKVYPDFSNQNLTPVLSQCERCGMDALYMMREPAVQKSKEGILHPYLYYWFVCGRCGHTWKKEQKVTSAYIIDMKTNKRERTEAVMAGVEPEEISEGLFAEIIRFIQ